MAIIARGARIAAVLAFLAASIAFGAAPANATARQAVSAPVEASLSIVVTSVSGVDLQQGTFDATFYLGVACPPGCDAAGWDAVNARSIKSDVSDESPGSTWWRVSGTFVFEPDLRLFPFDTQRLPIVIEHQRDTADAFTFVPDPASSEIGPTVAIPGWQIEPFTFTAANVGYAAIGSEYSEATFSIPIGRSVAASLTKYFGPLLVFILLAASSLVVNQSDAYLRTAGTAMVGLTVFYLATTGGLAAVGYLTLWDGAVLMAFGITATVLIAGIVGSLQYNKGAFEGPEGEERHARLRTRSLLVVIGVAVVGAVVVTAVAVLT